MRDQDIERLVRLNTLSPIVLTKYVVRSMMTERAGRIINISSIVASTGYSGLSVYSATKASLVGFTRSLAREVGAARHHGQRDRPGLHRHGDDAGTGRSGSGTRSRGAARCKRMAEPIDVARSVEFLLGEAGRNITGTVITVDAGNTA